MENMAVILCLAQQRLTPWLAHRPYRAIKSAAVIDLAILIVYYTLCASGAVCGFLISKPQYCSMDGYTALLQSFIAVEQRVKPENSLLPLCSFASNIQIDHDLNKFIRKNEFPFWKSFSMNWALKTLLIMPLGYCFTQFPLALAEILPTQNVNIM